jgi:hypothetical protein
MECVTYRGVKFYPNKKGYYYLRYSPTSINLWHAERALHRVVWLDIYGEIPLGYEVHHKDGNRANNAPTNLQCLLHSEHRLLHRQESLKRLAEAVAARNTVPEHPCTWHRCKNSTTRPLYCASKCARKAYAKRRREQEPQYREKLAADSRSRYKRKSPEQRSAAYIGARTSTKPYKPHKNPRV